MDMEQLITKYDSLATQVAPDVLEKLLQATSLGGLGYIITGLILLAFWSVLMYIAYRSNPTFDDMNDNMVLQVLVIILSTLVLFLPGMLMAADMWNWIAIWRPDLALTHQIINSIGCSK